MRWDAEIFGNEDPKGRPPRMRKIVMMSDIHDMYHMLFEPMEGDILLLAGDLTSKGTKDELYRCNEWLKKQKFTYKIVIPGNHDVTFETKWPWAEAQLTAADAILDQEGVVVDGIKIWGEPRQPFFYNWAFNVVRDKMKEKCWDKVPTDIDVLLTHGPPWGVCDLSSRGKHVGCVAQREWILEHQPRMVVCGHIHSGYGMGMLGKTLVVNAATCNEFYKPVNPPQVVYMNVEGEE